MTAVSGGAHPRGVAVVTGAHGAIGGEVARRLGARGYEVVCPVRPGREPVPGAARSEECDLSSTDDVARLAAELAAGPSAALVLVNCAAEVGPLRPLAEVSPADWHRVLQVNFGAAAQLSLALLPRMVVARRGLIVNVSSAAGLAPAPSGMGAYAVSKSCLNRFTAQLAADLPDGVTAHALHPGDVASAMWREISEQARADQRLGDLRDWAEMTGTAGDDPRLAADVVERLLDPDEARARHGHFLWPVGHGSPPVDLRAGAWPAVAGGAA